MEEDKKYSNTKELLRGQEPEEESGKKQRLVEDTARAIVAKLCAAGSDSDFVKEINASAVNQIVSTEKSSLVYKEDKPNRQEKLRWDGPKQARNIRQRKARRRSQEMKIGGDFGSKGTTAVDGVVCVLSVLHYMFDECIGATIRGLKGVRLGLDTGAGFNLIWRNILPVGSENVFERTTQEPKLKDANGNSLNIE